MSCLVEIWFVSIIDKLERPCTRNFQQVMCIISQTNEQFSYFIICQGGIILLRTIHILFCFFVVLVITLCITRNVSSICISSTDKLQLFFYHFYHAALNAGQFSHDIAVCLSVCLSVSDL